MSEDKSAEQEPAKEKSAERTSAGKKPPATSELRRRARQLAMQALYQWQMSKSPTSQIEAEFMVDQDTSRVDLAYFREILRGVPTLVSELDADLAPLLDRRLQDVDPVECALIRMGAFEMRERIDVPYRVVINEGVELAKKFGGTDGHKFVNGILDKLASKYRQAEKAAERSKLPKKSR